MDIETKVKNLKNDFENHIMEIEKLDNYLFRDLCLFSVIEQYTQYYSPNEGNNRAFNIFLKKYSKEELLNHFDPITSYYHYNSYENILSDSKLDFLHNYENPVVPVKVILNINETKEILKNIKNIENIKGSFNFCSQLYKFRCKLSHELVSPSIIWDDEQQYDEPYYSCVSDFINGEETWHLNFPYEYLKRIFRNSIYNYLDDCIRNKKTPFENMKKYLSWQE